MAAADYRHLATILSWLLGWLYFLAWTISFLPQPLLNLRRRSTLGVQPDFPLLNVCGFACYTLSTTLFLFSTEIRAQYASRHPRAPEPTVRENDVVFGVIALGMSVVTYSQYWPRLWGWEEKGQGVTERRLSPITSGLIWGSVVALVITAGMVMGSSGSAHGADEWKGWAWIDVVYAMEYVKLGMTVFKYIPQVAANFRRRSTVGWSIAQQLLDLTGGVGSLLQLLLDSSVQQDWSGVTGNPLKLGLANISLFFDVIFVLQHYVWFGPVEGARRSESERQPMLAQV